MNVDVGSSFAAEQENEGNGEEEEYMVDEHGEGMTAGRTVNYTAEEDRLLCRAWLGVAMDPVVGTDQSRGTYCARMKEYFDARNTSVNEHTDCSLRSRWSVINTDCQKWAGALAGVDKINPSGTATDDRNNIAQNLFKDQGRKDKKGRKVLGKSFVLHHCFEELGNGEKWRNRDGLDVHNLGMNATEAATIIDDDASSYENKKRSSTPHSGAFGGMGATRGAFGGYGVMGGMGLGSMGGMGAPPGGFMASLVNNPSPSINVDGYGMEFIMNNAPGRNVDGYGDSSRANTTHTTVQDSQGEEAQNGSGNGNDYDDVDK